VDIDRKKGSYYFYRNNLRHLSCFIKSKYGLDDFPLNRLNDSFIMDFDRYLRVDCRMSVGSILGHLIRLKRVVNRAVRQGILLRDPFADFVPERPRWKYRNISGEDLEKLLRTPVASPAICFTRDMFVFSCFTGLSHADIRNLSVQHLRTDEDGSRWIIINRQKTGGESFIPLLEIPAQIIEKYRWKRTGERLFNMVSTGRTSLNLRKVEALCGIGYLQYGAQFTELLNFSLPFTKRISFAFW
jgi:integrase